MKNKNIHLIPTDKPGRLHLAYNKNYYLSVESFIQLDTENYKSFNIYITSDEEIKEGDCSFYPPFGLGRNIIINGELCFHIEAKDGIGSFTQRTYQTLGLNKKIILTTDQSLDGVQAIDDEFLEWFVKNPSCEEVEVEKQIGCIDLDAVCDFGEISCPNAPDCLKNKYKIIIPKEESKQETLEEAAQRLAYDSTEENKGFPSIKRFIEGAKWQQERMYSEEEIIQLIQFLSMSEEFNEYGSVSKETANYFMRQFKKK